MRMSVFPVGNAGNSIAKVVLALVLAITTRASFAEGWTSTQDAFIMATGRQNHTLTELKDGRVLAVGGYGTAGLLAQCEIWDPTVSSGGAWTVGAALSAERAYHTATLLVGGVNDGRVLVAGGQDAFGSVNSLAMYDPATNSWLEGASLQPMHSRRAFHTATRLPDGTVLFAGGFDNTSGAEVDPTGCDLYDPATNTMTAVGALTDPRSYHTATLVNNGTEDLVMVAAGKYVASGVTHYLFSSEVYHVSTQTWSAGGTMPAAPYMHTAGLLPSGRVIVAAGYYNGPTGIGELARSQIYDPITNLWTPSHILITARSENTGTMLNTGQFLVTGGRDNLSTTLTVERYNEVATTGNPSNTWTAAPGLPVIHMIDISPQYTRIKHVAILLTHSGPHYGKVFIAGGYNAGHSNAPIQGQKYLQDSCLYNANRAPTDVLLSPSSVPENSPVGTLVGTLTSLDPDIAAPGDTFTYSLVPLVSNLGVPLPTDNALFTIVGDKLYTSSLATFNYEAKNTCSVNVQTTDAGGLGGSKLITVTVSNVNETPTGVVVTPSSVPTNRAAGTVVGTLSSLDPDLVGPNGTPTSDTFTYALVTGAGSTGNTFFSISNTTLYTAAVLSAPSYSIRVRTTDAGGLFFEQALTITTTNVNAPPTDITLNPSSVPENSPAGTTVGTLVATDLDVTDTYTFTVTGGPDASSFTTSGSLLKTTVSFDFEVKNVYTISVLVSDGAAQPFTRTLTINVTNVNEAPTAVTLSTLNIDANRPVPTTVGTLTSTDPDNNGGPLALGVDTFTYTFAGGADDAKFSITGSSLKTAAVIPAGTLNILVRSTDAGGLSFVQPITITSVVNNVAPTDILFASVFVPAQSIPENSPAGTTVGTLSSVDLDVGDTGTFTLVAGSGSTDNASFATAGTGGSLLQTLASFNYEVKSGYSIRVRVTDASGNTKEKVFVITVTNVNEAPSDITLIPATLVENSPVGTVVGTIAAIDPDAGDTATYALVAGTGSTDNTSFQLAGTVLKTKASFNFEVKNNYSIRVRATDSSGLPFEKQLTITVTGVNEAPSFSSPITVNPNPALVGQTVTLTAFGTDVDAASVLTYAWDFGDGTTGTGASVTHTYSTVALYTITVVVTDNGGLSATQSTNVIVGTVLDTDGDGVSDTIETLLGTSPADPTSIPEGTTVVQPLTYVKLTAKLDFKNNKDLLTLAGELKSLGGVDKKDTLFYYDIGGVSGKTTSGSSSLKVTLAKNNIVKYTLTLKGSFHDKLASSGLMDNTTTSIVKIPISLYVAGQLYSTTITKNYSGKKGVLGAIK